MSSRKKIMITLIIILLLLTAGVYGYGVYYFTEHFLPGSMVNGFNCSYMTVSQSEELLTQKVGAYVLIIDTRNNGQESITAKQAGLSYDSDGSVDKLIRNQDRFTWFLADFRSLPSPFFRVTTAIPIRISPCIFLCLSFVNYMTLFSIAALINKLLFTPFPATRFAMQEI